MIVGLGIDLIELDRIEKSYRAFQDKFIKRILHPNEQKNVAPPQTTWDYKRLIAFLAARFAAKEAAVKALGTGFSHGISFQDFEVFSHKNKKPELLFYGKALAHLQQLGVNKKHISLSHTHTVATAVVILEI